MNNVFVSIGAQLGATFQQVFQTADARMQQLGSTIRELQGQASRAQSFQQLTEATKRAGYEWQAAKLKVDELRRAMAATAEPTRAQANELRRAEQAAERASQRFRGSREALNSLRGELERAGVNTRNLVAEQTRLGQALQANERHARRLQSVMSAQEANMQARGDYRGQLFDAVALGATVAAPVRAAVQFETAMLGVARQVEGARDANGQLTEVYHQMGREIRALAREIPLTTTEIADMVTAGARMGIARDQLIDFTKTSAMMATAFDAPAGQLAEQMGKVAQNFKIPITAIGDLADAINYLDDNAISKGGDIIEVLNRVSGQAQQVGMSAKDVAALASTFLTTGASAEVASTATTAMIRELSLASVQPKRFQSAMEQLGLSSAEVQRQMTQDATGTIKKVLEAINRLPKEAQTEVTVGLFGKEYGDDAARLANNVGEFTRQLGLANGEAARGSMGREFSARLQTTAAQFTIAANRTRELGIVLGAALLPAINSVLETVTPLITAVAEFAEANPRLTTAIVGTVAALVSLKIAAVAAGYAFTFLRGAGLAVAKLGLMQGGASAGAFAARLASMGSTISALATNAIPMLTTAFATLGTAIAGITAPVWIAIAALVAGAALVWKYWDYVAAFFKGVGQGIYDALVPVFSEIQTSMAPLQPVFDEIGRLLGVVWNWFKELLTPVSATSEELEGTVSAGRMVGQVLGTVLGAMVDMFVLPLKMVAFMTDLWQNMGSTVSAVWEGIKSAIGQAIDWLMAKIKPLMDATAWLADKAGGIGSAVSQGFNWVTGGNDAGGAAGPTSQTAAAAVAAAAAPAARSVTNSPSYAVTVNGAGGAPQDTAAAVRKELERFEAEKRARNRAALYDTVN